MGPVPATPFPAIYRAVIFGILPRKLLYNTSVLHVENSVCIGEQDNKAGVLRRSPSFSPDCQCRITPIKSSMVAISRLEDGSSSTKMSGWIASAEAQAIFCFSPPDRANKLRFSSFSSLRLWNSFLQTFPASRDRQGHVFTPKNDLAGGIYIVELRPWFWNTDPTRCPDLIKRIVF